MVRLGRIHQTLRVTPAMAANVAKTLWAMDDIVKVVEEWEGEKDKWLVVRD